MRILIDVQGGQSVSAQRGIGRYTTAFVEALVGQRGQDDVHLLVNLAFPQTAQQWRERYSPVLGADHIHGFAPVLTESTDATSVEWSRRAGEAVRTSVIERVSPDVVIITSLFEGLTEPVVLSVGDPRWRTTVVVYDLIPHLFSEIYLTDGTVREWYRRRFEALRQADLLLAISEHTRVDTIRELEVPESRVVNIGSAIEQGLARLIERRSESATTPTAPGLSRPFLMYTGGIEQRKNIPRLIEAYSEVDPDTRRRFQLAIVCAIQPADRAAMNQLSRAAGLDSDEVIFTGFVSDEELIDLYAASLATVFPSTYEGFGLPVLEAMACGRATIASNTSSLPEIIGRSDALFDPTNTDEIAALITRVLTDDEYRRGLERHGQERSLRFSWETTAQRAWAGVRSLAPLPAIPHRVKPRLALVTPLPPTATGIADYSAELIPALRRFYDITAIVADGEGPPPDSSCDIRTTSWFRDHHRSFDRIVYQVGGSVFHNHMFDLLERIPGVVVLHDFFLSGPIALMDLNGETPRGLARAIYESHGYGAVLESTQLDTHSTLIRYPMNLRTLQLSDGVIVHSLHAIDLLSEWCPGDRQDPIRLVPLLREPMAADMDDRLAARRAFGFSPDDFVIGTFGAAAPTKQTARLVRVCREFGITDDERIRLVIVGQVHDAQVEHQVRLTGEPSRVFVTGRTDPETYRRFLLACDLAVQLRSDTRGETSAALLDCMNAGLAVIANAHGSAAELPRGTVWTLPDRFSDTELAEALTALRADPALRETFGTAARQHVLEHRDPVRCAHDYVHAIEEFARSGAGRGAPERRLRSLVSKESTPDGLRALADALGRSLPPGFRQPHLHLELDPDRPLDPRLAELAALTSGVFRLEPMFWAGSTHRFARSFMEAALRVEVGWPDEPIDVFNGDVVVVSDRSVSAPARLDHYRAVGATVLVARDPLTAAKDILTSTIVHRRATGSNSAFDQGAPSA